MLCTCYHVLLPHRFPDPPSGPVLRFRSSITESYAIGSPSARYGGDGTVLGRVLEGVRSPTEDFAIAVLNPGTDASAVPVGILKKTGPPRHLQDTQPGAGETVTLIPGTGAARSGQVLEYPASTQVGFADYPLYPMQGLIATSVPVEIGHSGGLLVDSAIRPLGLLVARSADQARSYFLPIRAATTRGVTPL